MMLMIFPMLMYVFSLTFRGAMNMTVHNLCPDIELASPVYFCNLVKYYEYPVKRTNTGTMMTIDFRFNPDQDESGGILMYEIQRKNNVKSDHQANIDTISAKVIEVASKMMRLLVTWKIKRSGKPKVNIMLVEYDDELVLNEDKLAQLYGKINDISSGNSSFGWLMYDNTVLVAKYEVAEEKDLELKITISKGAKYTMNSMWINSERQVLFLMAIYPMLIYIVSLTFQSVMNVTVNNQCSNIELVSPVHFIKNAIYHVQFPQRVEPNRIMRDWYRSRYVWWCFIIPFTTESECINKHSTFSDLGTQTR
jgi:hypothetical protein